MDDEACESCKFYEDVGDKTGFCHRYPPVIAPNDILAQVMVQDSKTSDSGCLPVVHFDDWCGEWRETL